ncbi:MAG TPA: triose-phosphate isomerase [Patescibacteria group bacterium]
MKRMVIGNWKMNLTLPEAMALAQGSIKAAEKCHGLEIAIAPSHVWLMPIKDSVRMLPPNFSLVSQAVSQWPEGAYTGDIAAKQLKGLVTYSLVGHSERRQYHHENGKVVSEQIKQLLNQGITPILCFGEMGQATQHTFPPQITIDLRHDLEGLKPEEIKQCIFAYEPLWAIGTGNPASPDYVAKAIVHVKNWVSEKYGVHVRIIYGGSVTEDNAGALGSIRELDGLLVGGASLQIKRFSQICSDFCSIV